MGSDTYIYHKTFSFTMSLPAMSFRTEGGGWVQPQSEKSMATSGVGYREALVGTERAMQYSLLA